MNTLLLMTLLAGTATMEDLQALGTQSAWAELLERAEDVPAAKRTDEWRALVTKAATAVVQADDSRAAALSSRYPFLASSPAFSKLNGSASVSTTREAVPVPPSSSQAIGVEAQSPRNTISAVS